MTFVRLLLFLMLAGLALLGFAYWTAVSDPVIRQTRVELRNWPEDRSPVRILLLSDIHVAGPDMPPSRLERIVAQANRLKPDLALIAGDLVSDKRSATHHYSLEPAIAPLARLRARIGTFAVLGNHDHWRNAAEARRALSAAGVRVLDNEAVEAGPVAVGGIDDAFTGHDDLAEAVGQLRRLPGAKVLLSHSPDPFPEIPGDISLMLAGHTHCGQIRLPFIGAVSTMSEYGERYACGRVDEAGKTLVVSAGLGTSILPLRLGTAPELWLIEIGSRARSEARR